MSISNSNLGTGGLSSSSLIRKGRDNLRAQLKKGRRYSRIDDESLSLCAVVLLAFSLPKVYELKKDEVDHAVSSVQKQTTTYYKQYAEPYVQKIPRASTSTAKTGSVTAGNHANTGDSADSYTHVRKPVFEGTGQKIA